MSMMGAVASGEVEAVVARLRIPTPAYAPEQALHPLQEQIERIAEWALDQDMSGDSRLAILEALEACRWIRLDDAAGIPTNVQVVNEAAKNLNELINVYVRAGMKAVDGSNRERFFSAAAGVKALLRNHAPALHAFEVAELHGDVVASLDIESRQRRLESIDELYAEVEQKVEGLAALVDRNAAAAIAEHYDRLTKDEAKSSKAAADRVKTITVVGPIVLLVIAAVWGWIIASSDLKLGTESILIGLGLKLPVTISWLWLLRLASRDYSAAQHRKAVAEAKSAALLTYDMLRDRASTSAGHDALLSHVAPLVFDPTHTGIIRDHGDAISVGPQNLSFGAGAGQ